MWRAVWVFSTRLSAAPHLRLAGGDALSLFPLSFSLPYSNSQSLLGWTYTRSRPERALVSLVPEFDIHSVDGIKQESVSLVAMAPSST